MTNSCLRVTRYEWLRIQLGTKICTTIPCTKYSDTQFLIVLETIESADMFEHQRKEWYICQVLWPTITWWATGCQEHHGTQGASVLKDKVKNWHIKKNSLVKQWKSTPGNRVKYMRKLWKGEVILKGFNLTWPKFLFNASMSYWVTNKTSRTNKLYQFTFGS